MANIAIFNIPFKTYTMTIQNIEDVRNPVKVGEQYLVPCIVKRLDELMYITPVINHPHTDRENGQNYIHYHADYRFVKHNKAGNLPHIQNTHSKHIYVNNNRPVLGIDGQLEYYILPVINEEFAAITPITFIQNSKLKHNCIYKGKCPHRGFDLSQVPSKNGIITCPLHGLKFDEKTKNLIL